MTRICVLEGQAYGTASRIYGRTNSVSELELEPEFVIFLVIQDTFHCPPHEVEPIAMWYGTRIAGIPKRMTDPNPNTS